MQGRLSPPLNGRIQAFPKYCWAEEFAKARICGLELIEWIFEADEWESNPLFAAPQHIQEVSDHHRVSVKTICADYFMDLPLVRVSPSERAERIAMLKQLIAQAGHLGVECINLPFVDHSAITADEELAEVAVCLQECLPIAQQHSLDLALETSLGPAKFADLLRLVNHSHVKVNYDIGNSASLGYDTVEEIAAYGRWIATVHIKDRVEGGGTVPLGQGDADFDAVFSALSRIAYEGPFVLQAARDGDELLCARRNVELVRNYLKRYF